ncbi:hypothetical protein [Nonomuraea guangzhouensis]|uniref:DUF5134 domain-containing protein n=1 Tax=Nonomuraea guangzhouensis TaxID=1291555 RepID=A0ABW4GR16_9ACTN|nr:hypothetical protein [Nonomuraea guangzhouensis]
MIESIPIRWVLALLLAGTALWFLSRSARPGSGGGERISHLAHALMAATMIAMIWPMG